MVYNLAAEEAIFNALICPVEREKQRKKKRKQRKYAKKIYELPLLSGFIAFYGVQPYYVPGGTCRSLSEEAETSQRTG
jgi:uncharacterized membrane-anchored protein